jgi:hypothetical protein
MWGLYGLPLILMASAAFLSYPVWKVNLPMILEIDTPFRGGHK